MKDSRAFANEETRTKKDYGVLKLPKKSERLFANGLASNPGTLQSTQYSEPARTQASADATPPTRRSTSPRSEKNTGLIGPLGDLKAQMPAVFTNLSSNSSEDKLVPLNLLDDTLMNLSMVLSALQKRISQEDELLQPETIKALTEVSKEIRALTQLKFDVAREMAEDQVRRVRLAMDVEKHAKHLLERKK